eukprot:1138884-Pelagomonas_calceolata.AAC.9
MAANPHLPDCPIVFVSEPFLKLTGYSRNASSTWLCACCQRMHKEFYASTISRYQSAPSVTCDCSDRTEEAPFVLMLDPSMALSTFEMQGASGRPQLPFPARAWHISGRGAEDPGCDGLREARDGHAAQLHRRWQTLLVGCAAHAAK